MTSHEQNSLSRSVCEYSVRLTFSKGEFFTPPHSLAAAAAERIMRRHSESFCSVSES